MVKKFFFTGISSKLSERISSESLAVFRAVFGLIMLWEVFRYFQKGWIERYWVTPEFNFKYEFFSWVEPLSADGMVLLFYLLGVLSIFITIGFLSRLSAALFFIIFTYTFLLEQVRYLNHFYLVMLINFILIFTPAHRKWSVDAWLFPGIGSHHILKWPVLILQIQIGIVYFFGGIAKLNSDWLSGSPMDAWLPRRSDFPVIGPLFELQETALFMSYSGLMLDLLAFPMLMYRKTRPWMILSLVIFHFMNDRLFTIGIFPWFMILALTIYLPPSWPSDLRKYISGLNSKHLTALFTVAIAAGYTGLWFHEEFSILPLLSSAFIGIIIYWDFHRQPAETGITASDGVPMIPYWITLAVILWCTVQVLVPLRHNVIPGNPSWTEEGHRFAWHMKLRSKSCSETFYVEHPDTGERLEIPGTPLLENWQRRKLSARPQLVIQYAQYISRINNDQPVYADIECSLNGNPPQRLIDPDVDLTTVKFYDWKANEWILR